jgi:hypothetical protein
MEKTKEYGVYLAEGRIEELALEAYNGGREVSLAAIEDAIRQACKEAVLEAKTGRAQ